MNRSTVNTVCVTLAIVGLALPTRTGSQRSEIVTMEEALTVARNWVTVIVHHEGSWGGAETAEVKDIHEFKPGARLLGYLCPVKPHGFVLISLRRELAPVKAYSAQSNLDPASGSSMAGLISGGMERIVNRIENEIGPLASVRTEDLERILEIKYTKSWEELGGDPATLKERLASGDRVGFQGGAVLLSSSWAQGHPYNRSCPLGQNDARTMVGCVATAAAQIMNYWAWPPSGTGNQSYTWDGDESCSSDVCGTTLGATFSDPYDWAHMAGQVLPDGAGGWQDEAGTPLAQAHVDAVAELSYEVGVAVDMDYGIATSGVALSHMEEAFEDHFRYARDGIHLERDDYSGVEWFDRMKDQFSANRPVLYQVPGHALVADGWQEVGSTPSRQVHMNLGWGPNAGCGETPCDLWVTLDALPVGDQAYEAMLEDILPAPALGSWLSGRYSPPSFPYRYVDRDATGHEVVFEAGHYLQFLPGVEVACTSPSGGRIAFRGSSTGDTRLFTRGDPSRGIRIHNGHIHLLPNGTLGLH